MGLTGFAVAVVGIVVAQYGAQEGTQQMLGGDAGGAFGSASAGGLLRMPDPSQLACKEPTSFKAPSQMRMVRDTVLNIPGIHVVWQEEWKSVKFDPPLLASNNPMGLCSTLDSAQFKYCINNPQTKQWQTGEKKMKLFVILTPCAFADRGVRFSGGLYQSDKYIIAAHAASKPHFRRGKIIRFDKLGLGLLPYGHDGQSHFWVGTAPYVCTLLKVLPKDIKILVSLNAKTTPLWKLLGVDMSRFVAFDTAATYYAREMYSVTPHPYGVNGKLGAEPAGPQAYARMMLTLFPNGYYPKNERTKIILISRADRGARRLTNHVELLEALKKKYPEEEIVEFVGTKQSVAESKVSGFQVQ
jgi:hypothetical protein